jgi:anti-sigma B factor antagonist
MLISSRTPEGAPGRCRVCGATLKIEPSDPAGDAPCPRRGHLLWFTWEDLGDEQVIRPTGDLLRPESLDRLIDSLAARRGARLVIDFNDVRYLSSADLAGLINLKKKVETVRGKVRLRSIHPDLREFFRICRLDQVFEIES